MLLGCKSGELEEPDTLQSLLSLFKRVSPRLDSLYDEWVLLYQALITHVCHACRVLRQTQFVSDLVVRNLLGSPTPRPYQQLPRVRQHVHHGFFGRQVCGRFRILEHLKVASSLRRGKGNARAVMHGVEHAGSITTDANLLETLAPSGFSDGCITFFNCLVLIISLKHHVPSFQDPMIPVEVDPVRRISPLQQHLLIQHIQLRLVPYKFCRLVEVVRRTVTRSHLLHVEG